MYSPISLLFSTDWLLLRRGGGCGDITVCKNVVKSKSGKDVYRFKIRLYDQNSETELNDVGRQEFLTVNVRYGVLVFVL